MKASQINTDYAAFDIHDNSSSQCCEQTNNIANITGKILVVSGVAGTTLFYTAPVTVPTAAATVIAIPTFFVASFISSADGSACVNGLVYAFLTGGLAATMTAYRTWRPIVNFVYTSETAKLAGLIGVGMIATGGALWMASSKFKSRNN